MSLDVSRNIWVARTDPKRRTWSTASYVHTLGRHGIGYDQPITITQRQPGAAIEGALRQTLAPIQQIFTDTHGYSAWAMGLSKQCGYDLCPRLKSLLIPGLALLVGCASTMTPLHQSLTVDPTQSLTPVITRADDPRLIAANRYALELGYKIETHTGVQYYCRKTAPIGSRIEHKECLTVDTMVQTQKSAEANNTRLLQQQACPKSGCPTS